MRNRRRDSKTSSILSRIPVSKNLFLLLGVLSSLLFVPQLSFAEVFIPPDEYVGYFDSTGIYTVVGNVKNDLDYAIIPTIFISVKDTFETFSKTIQHVPVPPGEEIPFKIKFPEISEINWPVLMPAEISFEKTKAETIPVDVIYDQTLIVHEDGHLTGRITNSGTETISDIKIFAIIHGFDNEALDMGQNTLPITEMRPGETREFSMYPDPTVATRVWYYSCFAVGQDSVVVLNVPRGDDAFRIRYDSGILLSYPEFDSKETSLSFNLIKGWPLQNSINLEFPKYSENESLKVSLNDQHVDSIQSTDDMGNWHVAFLVEPQSSGVLTISGFDPNGELIEAVFVPEWLKNNAGRWADGQLDDDSFVQGIRFLIEENIINISDDAVLGQTSETSLLLPPWLKNNAKWWSDDLLSDSEFLKGVEWLILTGLVRV